ncbi:ATP-binding protein [Streptomyces sp. CB03238]|uniref:ATP-binding protein n=1 Tax=Streptomyces sp. CB03238 TaxID=1907777 RepID=UPI000A103799|nr:ATP-binding protein [Streptomyces sp. CB03238]ORT55788.1 ATP-binding protein [Streptomyces sp. CB03238]
MVTGPLRDDENSVCPEVGDAFTARFDGEISDVTDIRLAARLFLGTLMRHDPSSSSESGSDILLVVTELASNAIQYAPGPFTLRMRRTFDGVHVTVADQNPAPPTPRTCDPTRGAGGLGWHLIQALSRQVSVVPNQGGKEIHAFLPW